MSFEINMTIVNNLVNALLNKFEQKGNKKNDISGNFENDLSSYPTVQAVKNHVSTSTSNFITKDVNNLTNYTKTSNLSSVATSGSYNDLSNKPSYTAEITSSTANAYKIGSINISGSNVDIYGKDTNTHQSLDSKTISISKKATADSGYAHTYIISQGGTELATHINIPKDFLVKSGTVKTAASSDLSKLGSGFAVGDKYIDFVINAKEGSATDEHIYINVKDLVEDTTYTADNSTLELLNNGQFQVKAKGITATQIADSVPAKNITSSDIANWNSKSEMTEGNVEDCVEAYLSAITTTLNGGS